MNALRDMLNEFYENIPEWLRQPVIDSINAADIAAEEHVITPLSQLIINLDRGNTEAINLYMTNPVTRRSVTRRFFFPHTLPGNLYPEDVYVVPPPPTDILALSRAPMVPMVPPSNPALLLAMATVPQPSLILPASTFEQLLPSSDFVGGDGFEYRPSLAPALRMNAVILSQGPPRIDSFFQPGVSQDIAAMAAQVPDPEQAQAPSVIRRAPQTLQNDLIDEIYE